MSSVVSQVESEKKEERIAAARQKNGNNHQQITQTYLPQDELAMSGRSSPASSSTRSTNNNNNNNNNNGAPFSQSAKNLQFPQLTNFVNDSSINSSHFKEQLQIHLQTIGILVAEKAELQSKLQQTVKKSDKKQDECDELMGRLKASRQKIADLEKVVQHQQQFNQQQLPETNAASLENDRLKSELSSALLLVDELRLRLNESNEKLGFKQQETQKLAQQILDFKSQMEFMSLRMSQLGGEHAKKESDNESEDKLKLKVELDELRARNSSLEAKLSQSDGELTRQREAIKAEYDCYVEQLRHQIDSLVDQINRMTDEREDAFAKIDRFTQLINASNKKNDELLRELDDLKSNYDALKTNGNQVSTNSFASNEKEALLENEIKYFKQQIEILVQDHNSMVKIIEDKEQSMNNLNKLLENYEEDRQKHSKLLEQMHNEKQTLSRAMQQNKELKQQFIELQDAFVNVTKQNLELTTKLQAEQFRLENIEKEARLKEEEKLLLNKGVGEKEASAEWGEEEEDESQKEKNIENKQELNERDQPTLLSSIKERIEYLEKENKDLNDYIVLMNQKLTENKPQLVVSNEESQISKTNLLNETIALLEHEKIQLRAELSLLRNEHEKILVENKNNTSATNPTGVEFNPKSYQLIEEKFNKVMKDNADLKEKNQELEHTIQQLQFETETIVDYITMYQIERSKLNEKYKLKDESIRSLSTQLQVNKLALQEMANYLSAFIRFSQETTTNQNGEAIFNSDNEQKKQIILYHIIKILSDLTQNSSATLNSINSSLIPTKTSETSSFSQSEKESAKLVNNNNSLEEQTPLSNPPQVNQRSLDPFRYEVVYCNSCQGDLFVV